MKSALVLQRSSRLLQAQTAKRLGHPRCLSTVASLIGDRESVLMAFNQNERFRNEMAYSLAMATSEGSKFPALKGPDELMKSQLRVSQGQLRHSSLALSSFSSSVKDDEDLPRTLSDALRLSKRAIVVTEKDRPFRICNVNKAWEGLCGYSYVESKGKTLGELLRGPETDPLAVTALVGQLLQGEDATTVITNYTKSGRKFRNRLKVGPLVDERGITTHFVGVLQEVYA